MQRSEYSPYQKPQFDIDHRTAVMIAYQNCLNSFQMPENTTASEAQQGISRMVSESKATMTRFTFNLGVLDGLLEDEKDADFKKEKPVSVVELFSSMKDPLHPAPAAWFGYWTRIDKLLRDKELFAAQRVAKAHI